MPGMAAARAALSSSLYSRGAFISFTYSFLTYQISPSALPKRLNEGLPYEDKTGLLVTKQYNLDVLVDGRFKIEERDLSLLFRGSRNQRLIDVQRSLKNNRVVLVNEYEYNEEKYFEREPIYV